jgi:ABC-type Fe3+-siderophore transport system permease subunit
METEEERQAAYHSLTERYKQEEADYQKAEYARQKEIYGLFAKDLERCRQVQLHEDKQFYKYIAMFAAGAFGVSFAFINDIVPFPGAVHKLVLITAWACLAAALVINVAIHLISSIIHGSYYDMVSDNIQRGYDGKPLRPYKKWYTGWVMAVLYWLDFVSFLGGMVCLVAFVFLNI